MGKLFYTFICSAIDFSGDAKFLEKARETAYRHGIPVTWAIDRNSFDSNRDFFSENYRKFGDGFALYAGKNREEFGREYVAGILGGEIPVGVVDKPPELIKDALETQNYDAYILLEKESDRMEPCYFQIGERKVLLIPPNTLDLQVWYCSGREYELGFDPAESISNNVCDGIDVGYWKRLFDNYLLNTAWNDSVFIHQCLNLADITKPAKPEISNNKFQTSTEFQIQKTGYKPRLCRGDVSTKNVYPAGTESNEKSFDNACSALSEFFKHISSSSAVPSLLDSVLPKITDSTLKNSTLYFSDSIGDRIKKLQLPKNSKSVMPPYPDTACPDTLFYTSGNVRFAFIRPCKEPQYIKDYATGMEYNNLEIPKLSAIDAKRSRDKLNVNISIDSKKNVPYGLVFWENHNGLKVVNSGIQDVRIFEDKFMVTFFGIEKGMNNFILEMSI